MSRWVIFILGIVVWGVLHKKIQARFENEWLFIGLMVVYFLILRAFAEVFGKDKPTKAEPEQHEP